MKQNMKALRGMTDILPHEVPSWQCAEAAARSIFARYGYEEIRLPLMEETALFTRSIGEETDIVQKQMYSFKDRGERDVSLRPEGTASVARAYIEHSMDQVSPISKLYYIGPMFRNERPQAGRLRQFNQMGAELIGSASPYADAEIISLMMGLLEACGLTGAELNINSLGCEKDKKAFEKLLRKEFAPKANALCPDCKKRYEKNILRVFDCKNDSCRQLLRSAPKITECLCESCSSDFEEVKAALDSTGIKYSPSPFLVRGLDYYTGVVFEITHKNLGAQDAVAAGGRYDNLIGDIGGPRMPACGFAVGVERMLLAAQKTGQEAPKKTVTEIFLIGLGRQAQRETFKVLAQLRKKGVSCQMGLDDKSLKSQMRFADKIKARRVLIIGDSELKNGAALIRNMENKEQKEIRLSDVTDTHLW
jgi:histidyl-tRNA synthetase